jgi:predicted TIM-barrel fold metal-dependent hydrolase
MTTQYSGPIIDVDIHHHWKSPDAVIKYLPQEWKSYLQDNVPARSLQAPSPALGKFLANGARMAESYPADGSFPGSDYPTLREQWLDKYPISHGILTHDVGDNGALLNQFFAEALCRAINDWNIDEWLSQDSRLYSVIVLPIGNPTAAAAEIRRVGQHPKIVGVTLSGNVLARPFGDPIYDPIYAAAEELGLVVTIHPTATGHRRTLRTLNAGGAPASTTVNASQFAQQAMHYISSYVSHGTFEKYPRLKVLIQEYGVAWLPWLLWRLDQNYEVMKAESPWLKRRPSEYVRDHIKLATQPLEESGEPKGLARMLESYEGMEDMLCFSSDYPHITADEPGYVARALPKGWAEKVFYQNAASLFDWEPKEAASGAARRTVTA